MLDFQTMAIRLVVALLLGGIIGFEREMVGKEAGIRTAMMVAGGAAIFTMIPMVLPGILGVSSPNLPDAIGRVVANIIVGIGFLGTGIIVKTSEHVRGLTTAAVMWVNAAVGTLVGIGLIQFAAFSAILIALVLYILRRIGVYELMRPKDKMYSNEV